MHSGGIADKVGSRYEAVWLTRFYRGASKFPATVAQANNGLQQSSEPNLVSGGTGSRSVHSH